MASTRRSGNGHKRAQLSREAILDAALGIAADGEQVTFRALGAALAADPTAVYRHFRDKDELVRAVFDRLLVRSRERVDPSAAWQDQVRQVAVATWEECEAHPSIGTAAHALTTRGPGEMASIELLVELLQSTGMADADAVRFYGVLSSYILAIAASIASSRLDSEGLERSTAWLGNLDAVDARAYPAVASLQGELSRLQDVDVYRTGLDVILDAAAAAARQPA